MTRLASTGARIAVTGSTGRLGGRVARRLAAAGIPQRLVVRDPRRAPSLDAAEVVVASYRDAASGRSALDGVTVLFMVSAEESVDRVDHHRTFIDAAVDAGVKQIVYTSFYNAAADATFTLARDHHATEEYIRASGLAWTFLRDNLYLDFFRYFAGEDGVIRGPAGDGLVSAVALDDIADAAAAVLSSPAEHAERTYDLTGPEAISFAEAAAVLTAETGRAFSYHAETIDDARASRAHYGAPDWQVEAWVSTYTAVAAGELDGVSADVAYLTGHQPMSLTELLRRQRP